MVCRFFAFVAVCVMLCGMGTPPAAGQNPPGKAGILIVSADAWPTSDSGFSFAPSGIAARFVGNIARLFVGEKKGNFLVYSNHWTFGEPFQSTLRKAGHRVTQTMSPGALASYDAVFVGGTRGANRDALAAYLKGGGRVYLVVTTGDIPDEDSFWNSFLLPFGLQTEATFPFDPMLVKSFRDVPLFDGVSALHVRGARNLVVSSSRTGVKGASAVLSSQDDVNFWAVAVVGSASLPPMPLGDPVVFPDNGHSYQRVGSLTGLTFDEAFDTARKMSLKGHAGHLVTLTTEKEQAFLTEHLPQAVSGNFWLGGYQDRRAPDYKEPGGGWHWVTGEPWKFMAWNKSGAEEPNNGDGNEDRLTFAASGGWNDTSGEARMNGFVVEFE